ncbi:MAG: translocation protein TolB [Calothrix sp. SM1_5_4]|nr:translocation protein TolB [Calothrix sp. SM1_5_4]
MWLLYSLLLSLTLPSARAQSGQIYIDIGQAQVKKSLLALPPLQYVGTQPANGAHLKAGQDLFAIIVNDLTVSNYFQFIKPDAFLEDPAKIGLKPAPGQPNGFNFKNWATIGTEFLVRAAYNVIGSEISMEVYLYHVPSTKLVLGKNYKSSLSGTRRMAHTFANDVVKALTGKNGMFLTKLTASRNEPGSPIKEIYIMDWDGNNPQKITSHQAISISPTWSSTGEKIAYTCFCMHVKEKVRNADLFQYDIASGKRFLLSYKKGINSGAAFLPGDAALLLTLSYQGTPDIYKLSADGRSSSRLTRGAAGAMSVEPAISPDGKTVAFSSDRSGRPMIYLMNIDGTNVRRLTFAGKYNASPSWSPDGKTIAFAGQDKSHFDIFTINIDGTNLKRLTDATKPNGRPADNESPSWSPDGRHVLFTSNRTGNQQLYIVSPDGMNERRITEDKYNWDKPKWSPYLN